MKHILAPGAGRDASSVQLVEGVMEDRAQALPRDQARAINRQIDVGSVVAVEHRASDQSPVAIRQADRLVGPYRPAPKLAHDPIGDCVVRGRVCGVNDHMRPPGT